MSEFVDLVTWTIITAQTIAAILVVVWLVLVVVFTLLALGYTVVGSIWPHLTHRRICDCDRRYDG